MSSALSTAKSLAKYNNDLERSNVALQYQYNRSLAQEDRSWQERMSNSAHQREIADLKKAGLNPVLSVTGGNGASTPSGSSASVSKANVDMSLPRAVMDMAMAQLNSATSLQIASMNNATDRYIHDTPKGSNFVNTFAKIVDDSASLFTGKSQHGLLGKALSGLYNSAKEFKSSNDKSNSGSWRATKISEARMELGILNLEAATSKLTIKQKWRKHVLERYLYEQGVKY